MMIVMKATATEDQVQSVIERIESVGAHAHPSRGEEVTVIGAIGDREHIARLELEGSPGVDRVVPILKPYKLASSQFNHERPSVLEIGGRKIGGEHFAIIAGPCTVETRDQLLTTAHVVRAAGATMLRGGAYKPRTSPSSASPTSSRSARATCRTTRCSPRSAGRIRPCSSSAGCRARSTSCSW